MLLLVELAHQGRVGSEKRGLMEIQFMAQLIMVPLG